MNVAHTVIYLRTSTEDQNPENQLKDCLSLNKWGEPEIIEEKVSGWKDIEREGFNKLYKMVMASKVHNIIVWDLDRLYRNRKKLVGFFALCKIKGVKVYSFRQTWLEDINAIPEPFNEIVHALMLQVMGWLAEEESAKKSQRVKSAMREKEDGIYSYKGNKWGRDKVSTFKRRRIQELRKEGLTVRAIANELKLSVGAVHKYLANYTPLKVSLKDSSQATTNEQIGAGTSSYEPKKEGSNL